MGGKNRGVMQIFGRTVSLGRIRVRVAVARKVESAPNSRPVFMQFVLQPRVVGNSVRGCTVTLANETTERSSLLTNS